jgi:uncharacterized membrane protein
MVRKKLKENIQEKTMFRYRGEEQTRIETFSDAVFALAITFLVVSQEAPKSFDELMLFLKELIPFAFCMALIVLIWYEHFKYFHRYGFKTTYIVFLNATLLFITLFYVYPLKFLAQVLISIYAGPLLSYREAAPLITWEQMRITMIVYGLGAAAIFIIFALMYQYAYRKKEDLQLNALEVIDTKASQRANLLMASIPAASVIISLLFGMTTAGSMISGFVYFLYFPVMHTHGLFYNKHRKRMIAAQEQPAAAK